MKTFLLNFLFSLKNKYIMTIAGIIGLINVDGEMFVLNAFLNKKLTISKIGHNIIKPHNIFSIVNFFVLTSSSIFSIIFSIKLNLIFYNIFYMLFYLLFLSINLLMIYSSLI